MYVSKSTLNISYDDLNIATNEGCSVLFGLKQAHSRTRERERGRFLLQGLVGVSFVTQRWQITTPMEAVSWKDQHKVS